MKNISALIILPFLILLAGCSVNMTVTPPSGQPGMSLVGSITHPTYFNNIHDVQVQGHYAYTVNNDGGWHLTVIDISDLAKPTIIGAVNVGAATGLLVGYNLSVDGEYAYATGYGGTPNTKGGIAIIDISNPTAPSVVGSLVDNTKYVSTHGLAIDKNILFFDSQDIPLSLPGKVISVDISDPKNPVEIDSLQDEKLSGVRDAFVQDNYLYTANGKAGKFAIVDVSAPAALRVISGLSDPIAFGDIRAVSAYGNYVYLAGHDSARLTIIDVSNPTGPVIVSSITDDKLKGGHDIHPLNENSIIVFARLDNRIALVDVSDPTKPTIGISLQDETYLKQVHQGSVSGNYIFVAADAVDRMTIVELAK